MKTTKEVFDEFFEGKDRKKYDETEFELREVNPQMIKGITETYKYPDILNDRKTEKLKKKIEEFGGWDYDRSKAWTLQLYELPNGDLVVNSCGNHRAVLSKEMGMTKINARVKKIVLVDN